MNTDTVSTGTPSNAKRYNLIKIRLSVIDTTLTLVLLGILAFTDLSRDLIGKLEPCADSRYGVFLLFMLAVGLVMSLISLPLDFYGSFVLEHRFGLSNQSLVRWVFERTKSLAISLTLGLPIALAFYFFISAAGLLWWVYFSILLFVIAVILARLAPVLLFPIFYTFSPLEEGEVKDRLTRLIKKHGLPISGIFSFNMSKNTKKANAGFTGIGKSKRIILSDTLLDRFSPGEIEVIFAHEMGHYIKRHLGKNILLNGIIIFASMFMCSTIYNAVLAVRGFVNVYDIAAIPILLFFLAIFTLAAVPVINAISRSYEWDADRYALETTGNSIDFISSMKKLSLLNLSDPEPHPLVEFLFYSHPSIKRRIEAARGFEP